MVLHKKTSKKPIGSYNKDSYDLSFIKELLSAWPQKSKLKKLDTHRGRPPAKSQAFLVLIFLCIGYAGWTRAVKNNKNYSVKNMRNCTLKINFDLDHFYLHIDKAHIRYHLQQVH